MALAERVAHRGLPTEVGQHRRTASEVAHPPFGILMTFDSPPTKDFGRISYFADFDYDEVRDVTLLMSTGEIYSPYPDDNRGRSSFRR
jgi:hypothetical protein